MSDDNSRFVASFEGGEVIFREGDPGSEMYIIKNGKVAIWKDVAGERTTLTVLEKGDFFGEMSLLEGSPRAATAEAVEACELMRIDGSTFSNMVRQNVEIAVRMMRKLSARLRQANEKISDLRGGALKSAPVAASAGEPPAEEGGKLIIEPTGREIPLWKKETRLGRFDPVTGEHPDVDLSDEEMGRSVSRRHARIVERAGQFYLVGEIGVLNPLLLNDASVEAATLTPLSDGDRISLGGVQIVFRAG
jgi:CRP-like cAMP-binding protein